MANKILAVIFLLAGLSWFVDAIQALTGKNDFWPITLALSFVITGGLMLKWAIEAWNE